MRLFSATMAGRWSMSTRFGIKPRPEVLPFRLLYFVVTQLDIKVSAVFLVFPNMLVDALVADRTVAIFRQPAADLIGAPLLLHQFFLDQCYEIRLHLAWRT